MIQKRLHNIQILWMMFNIHDYHPKRNRENLIRFDGIIADIMTNKECQVIIKELVIRCKIFQFQRKLD